jgi:uracil-DNA glycosylase
MPSTTKTRPSTTEAIEAEPPRDCPRCPRLVAFRNEWRAREPDWFNAPVHSFGPLDARLLIVGLAPGVRGANRTGRPFTGDYAGDLLYATLKEYGFSKGTFDARPDDGLTLIDARITNAVHCVPPENKPTPAEINTCRDTFLARRIPAAARDRDAGPHFARLNGAGAGSKAVRGAVCPWRQASRWRPRAVR